MNGAELIAAERQRQVEVEGLTEEHDDGHSECEMALAAKFYVEAAIHSVFGPAQVKKLREWMKRRYPHIDVESDEQVRHMTENPARDHYGWDRAPESWPWGNQWWKPSPDPIRNLVKAGALICAEIDRLKRLEDKANV